MKFIERIGRFIDDRAISLSQWLDTKEAERFADRLLMTFITISMTAIVLLVWMEHQRHA